MSEENKNLKSDPNGKKEDFTILYDYLPAISMYQILVFVLVGWSNVLGGAIQFAQIIFQAVPTNSTCVELSSGSVFVNESCPADCVAFEHSFCLFEETVNSEFDLVCDRSIYSNVISSLSIFGLFFGAVGLGTLADKIGRRNALLVAALGCSVFSFLTAVASVSLWSYTAWRMLAGAFAHGTLPVATVYAVEYVGVEYRTYAASFAYALFDVGIASLSLIGYLFRHWHNQAYALIAFPAVFVFITLWLPESIAFLYKSGKYDEGKKVVKRLMVETNTDLNSLDELTDKLERISEQQKTESEGNLSTLQLFSPSFRKVTFMCFLCMFSACLGSVGMFLDDSADSCDLLVNNAQENVSNDKLV